MPLQVDIGTAFQAKLCSGAVAAAVRSRVYDTQAPLRSVMPLIVWAVDNGTPWDVAARQNVDMGITLAIWVGRAGGATAARNIADKVYTLLHGASLTVSGMSGVTIGCVDRGLETVIDDAIVHESAWNIVGTTN